MKGLTAGMGAVAALAQHSRGTDNEVVTRNRYDESHSGVIRDAYELA